MTESITTKSGTGRRAALMYAAIVLLLIAGTVIISRYQQEIGIADASRGGVFAVAAAADVGRVLSSGADYEEFSSALRVALLAQARFTIDNPADVNIEPVLAEALQCYSALRTAWQADLDGAWDPEVYGDPVFWRASYPDVQLPTTGELTADEVIVACREQGARATREAVELAQP